MRISDWSSDVCSSDLGSGGWGSVPANRRRISARTRARNVAKISAEHARQEAVPARRADLADIVAAVAHAGLGLDRLDRVRRRLGAGRAHGNVVVLRCRIVRAAAVMGAEAGDVGRNQRQAGAQQQNGSASGREEGGKYGYILGGAGALKKKINS